MLLFCVYPCFGITFCSAETATLSAQAALIAQSMWGCLDPINLIWIMVLCCHNTSFFCTSDWLINFWELSLITIGLFSIFISLEPRHRPEFQNPFPILWSYLELKCFFCPLFEDFTYSFDPKFSLLINQFFKKFHDNSLFYQHKFDWCIFCNSLLIKSVSNNPVLKIRKAPSRLLANKVAERGRTGGTEKNRLLPKLLHLALRLFHLKTQNKEVLNDLLVFLCSFCRLSW